MSLLGTLELTYQPIGAKIDSLEYQPAVILPYGGRVCQELKQIPVGEMMAEEAISQEVLLKRLKRIEGQIRGIQKMIENGRDCESIITQLAAARSAIEGVGALMLNNYMKLCFRKGSEAESASISSLGRAIAIWGRVHVGDSDHLATT